MIDGEDIGLCFAQSKVMTLGTESGCDWFQMFGKDNCCIEAIIG